MNLKSNAALLVITLVGSLCFAEIALQIAYRAKFGAWLPFEERAFSIGYTQPVADRRQYALKPGFRDREVSVDDQGFRGDAPKPDADRPIIAVIGDSVPFGYGVMDDQTYPALLAAQLRGQSVSVLNAGVPSYNLRQSMDRLMIDVLPRYTVKTVVMGAANDVSLFSQYGEAWTPDITWADMRWKNTWQADPDTSSALVYFVQMAWTYHRFTSGYDFRRHPHDRLIEALQAQLDGFIEQLAARDIQLVLLPIDPFYYQVNNTERNKELSQWRAQEATIESWGETISAVNDLLARTAAQHARVHFLDTRVLFDAVDRTGMFRDFIHLTPEGARFVADRLMEFLAANELVPVRSSGRE